MAEKPQPAVAPPKTAPAERELGKPNLRDRLLRRGAQTRTASGGH